MGCINYEKQKRIHHLKEGLCFLLSCNAWFLYVKESRVNKQCTIPSCGLYFVYFTRFTCVRNRFLINEMLYYYHYFLVWNRWKGVLPSSSVLVSMAFSLVVFIKRKYNKESFFFFFLLWLQNDFRTLIFSKIDLKKRRWKREKKLFARKRKFVF